jgi:formylglycine-generating enzyme required for sulfatase activity
MLSKSEEERPWDGGEVAKIFRKNLEPDRSKIFIIVGGFFIALFIALGILISSRPYNFPFFKMATQAITLPTSILWSSPVEQNTPPLSDSLIEFNTTARSTQIPTELLTTTPTVTRTPEATPTKESSSTATHIPTDTPTQDPNRPPVNAQAGETWVSPIDGMTMIYVPEGEFLMGSTDDNPDSENDEKPQRSIFLDSFWIDQTEVTNKMFASFMNRMGNQTEEGNTWLDADSDYTRIVQQSGGWLQLYNYSDHPVVEVTWYGARSYCQWTGRRLPSEAEWEKAARGTDGRTYPWGEGIDCSRANYSGCVGNTKPAGSYPNGASPYGALDMAGNVTEWIADWYDGGYYHKSPSENPPGPLTEGFKVIRGGSWVNGRESVRTANRGTLVLVTSFWSYGFRCALSP